jgi:hypothetical protein
LRSVAAIASRGWISKRHTVVTASVMSRRVSVLLSSVRHDRMLASIDVGVEPIKLSPQTAARSFERAMPTSPSTQRWR